MDKGFSEDKMDFVRRLHELTVSSLSIKIIDEKIPAGY